MRIFKTVLSIIIIVAIAAGIFLYISSQGKEPSAPGVSGGEASGEVVINEFLASNSGVLPDENGNYSDWIEIANSTDHSVDISGFGLSDDKKSASWHFPSLVLQSKGYIVVFASGDGISDANAPYQHTSFKLSASGGGIYLFNTAGEIIDEVEYDAQTKDISVGRDIQNPGKFIAFDKPTPGFSNDDAGRAAFEQSRLIPDSKLILTEINPSNYNAIADNNGKYSDYIEIYNSGSEAVNLKGYGLSNDPQKVLKWKFPDISIGAGEYLVVFASGEDENSTDAAAKAIHTNFRLSTYKETIVLSNAAGYILDQASYKEIPPRNAYSRISAGGGAYQAQWETTITPTPGSENTNNG